MSLRRSAAALLPLLLLLGCRLDHDSSAHGDHLRMATPFGGLHVRTGDQAVLGTLGLPIFPGSTPVSQKNGNEDGAADVDLALGSLRVRVKALRFHSDAPPAEVRDFYQKALARFGTVILCQGHRALGQPTRTDGGLTCDHTGTYAGPDLDQDAGLELKAGSPEHQHLAAIESTSSHDTTFALVVLDLPHRVTTGSSDPDPNPAP